MNIYKVESFWSKELIQARSIPEAVKKYDKLNKEINLRDKKVIRVELIGELAA